jgi:hypothetical protein
MITTANCVNDVRDTAMTADQRHRRGHPKRSAAMIDRLVHHAEVIAMSGTQSCS